MKRKLMFAEEDRKISKISKMMKVNASFVAYEKNDVTDAATVSNGRNFTFNLTEKTAKSNLLKAANRNDLEIESKQKCMILNFNAGAYLLTAMPGW